MGVSAHAGVVLAAARGSRDVRATPEVRARLGAALRVARNWGLVRCSSLGLVRLLSPSSRWKRPKSGVTRENGHPSRQVAIRAII